MATLTIDGNDFEVVGRPGWQKSRPTTIVDFYIAARIRVSQDSELRTIFDKQDARLMLKLDDGSTIQGSGMWRVTADGSSDGTAYVKFEGLSVLEWC